MRIGPFRLQKRDVFSNFKFSSLISNIFLTRKKCRGIVANDFAAPTVITLRSVLHVNY